MACSRWWAYRAVMHSESRDSTTTVTPLPLPRQHRRQSRLARAISAPGLAGLAVFVVAVLVAITMVALRPHAPAEDQLAGAAEIVEGDVGAADASQPEGASGGQQQEERVYVHVVGEVKRPGVVTLSGGARVADAIEAAGGATDAAVLAGVNLAREVMDGEQILVPDAEQAKSQAAQPSGASGGVAGQGGAALVNLNTADQAALETLPRVGPALAQRIIEWRETNGRFASVDQLLDVSGIGEKTLAGFRDRVTV